jgi:hypothetical protein
MARTLARLCVGPLMACIRLYGEERADKIRTSEARIELPPP